MRNVQCKPQKIFNSSRIYSLCLTRFLKGKIRGNKNMSAANSSRTGRAALPEKGKNFCRKDLLGIPIMLDTKRQKWYCLEIKMHSLKYHGSGRCPLGRPFSSTI